MKTWGLHKQSSLHAWGLGGIIATIVDGWKDAVRFSVLIKRKLLNIVEF